MSDSYWKQFCSDGKIDSYLQYVQNEKQQDAVLNGTNTTNNRLLDNKAPVHLGHSTACSMLVLLALPGKNYSKINFIDLCL